MIKFEYIPWTAERTWGYAEDVPPVESVTMTLGHDVSWEEAVCEFHNFLRAAGYVIPYDFEEEEEKRSHEEFLQDLDAWAMDEGNTDVAPEDESNTPVAIVRDWGRIEWQEGVFPNLGAKLYMSPQEKREWVGLNDSEINEIQMTSPHYVSHKAISAFLPMIEAKLKEKNT